MAAPRQTRRPLTPALLGTLVSVVMALLTFVDAQQAVGGAILGDLERQSLDLRFVVRGPEPSTNEVAIVVLDEKTIASAPELFTRRKGIADVLRAMKELGARAIGVDVFFSAKENLLPERLVNDVRDIVPKLPDDGPPDVANALLLRVLDEVRGDDVLEEAFHDVRPVVLALHLGREGADDARSVSTRGATFGRVAAGEHLPPRAPTAKSSLVSFVDAAENQGLVSVHEDNDGRARSAVAALRIDGTDERVVASMPFILYAMSQGKSNRDLAFVGTSGDVVVADRRVPTFDGDVRLNFRGGAKSFATYSAVDVVNGELPTDALKDKIVFLALTHLSQDRVTTPFGARIPGVELHATVVDNLVRDDFLTKTHPITDSLLALFGGLVLVGLFVRRLHLRARTRFVASVFIAVGFGATTHVFFVVGHVWIAAVAPALTQLVTLTVMMIAAYLDEGLERYHLKRAFSRYLSPALLDELVKDPERARLSGDRQELTVLFSDIRDFTTISERIAPDALAKLLTRYFTPMTRAVLDEHGYLDKYIGDAIMAIFGAPVSSTTHAGDACRAAIAMHRALVVLRAELAREGVPLDIGIGLNTGEMIVGNMGSQERFDYTVIGDSVNLASRIEGLTKEYGAFCLVGPSTKAAAGDDFSFRTIDLVRVKGKEKPVEIFELLGSRDHVIHEIDDVTRFESAVRFFREGAFADARKGFSKHREKNPDDPLTELYLDRLDTLGDTPPRGWNGVFTYTHK